MSNDKNTSGIALPIVAASIYTGNMELSSISEKIPYGFEGLTKEVTLDYKGITFDIHL